MKIILLFLFSILAFCGVNSLLWALGEEHFGNAPLNELNYQDWKGIMPVINHQSRVYHTWVNGNEHFYYRGDTEALNDTLKKFAAVEADVREVILLPSPANTTSFMKDKQMPYDWNLHIVGGIAKHTLTKDKESNVWDRYPTIRVYVGGGNIELERIKIPKGVTISELADLRARYLKGLESADHQVRGYAAFFLAEVDFYNKENAKFIVNLLNESDN